MSYINMINRNYDFKQLLNQQADTKNSQVSKLIEKEKLRRKEMGNPKPQSKPIRHMHRKLKSTVGLDSNNEYKSLNCKFLL